MSSTSPIDVLYKMTTTWMYYVEGVNIQKKYFWATAFLCLLTFLPTVLHLILGCAYIIAKLVATVARRFLAVLFLRVSQGKDGVLRQLAIALGALTKLTEVLIKTMG